MTVRRLISSEYSFDSLPQTISDKSESKQHMQMEESKQETARYCGIADAVMIILTPVPSEFEPGNFRIHSGIKLH